MASRAKGSGQTWHAVEQALLTAYWAVSGYGLRASRALAALALIIALATVGLATFGFAHNTTSVYLTVPGANPPAYRQTFVTSTRPSVADALNYSIETTTSLLHSPADEPLTVGGRIIEIVLRLTGPLLLGLAVLALRGRVKR